MTYFSFVVFLMKRCEGHVNKRINHWHCGMLEGFATMNHLIFGEVFV